VRDDLPLNLVTASDLIEDWIEIRAKLQRQLKAIDSGEFDASVGSTTEATKTRLKKWIDALNALLKQYANPHRP